jgi:hypothetical protein
LALHNRFELLSEEGPDGVEERRSGALFIFAGVDQSGGQGGAELPGTATRRLCPTSRRRQRHPPPPTIRTPSSCVLSPAEGAEDDCGVRFARRAEGLACGDLDGVGLSIAPPKPALAPPCVTKAGLTVNQEIGLPPTAPIPSSCEPSPAEGAEDADRGDFERRAVGLGRGNLDGAGRSVTPSEPGLAPSSAMKDSLIEYQDMGTRLMDLLTRQRELGIEETEEHIAFLCIEQFEEVIHTEEELFGLQRLVQVVINRLEMKDGAIVELRPSEVSERSELRVLAMRLDLCAA